MSENGIGHNSTGLSEDHRRALGFHHKGKYKAALALKKKADADLKNVCRAAKADFVSVDDIKLLIDLESPEGEEKVRETINRVLEISRWSGSPVGTQFSFLDEPDRTPLTDRAYAEGRVAGYEAAPGPPPYDGEAEQEWLRGHHDGQQTLMAALDLTKAGIEEIRAEEEAAAAEAGSASPKKRGRPKGSGKKANKNGAAEAAAEPDEHAAEKAEDAKAFEGVRSLPATGRGIILG